MPSFQDIPQFTRTANYAVDVPFEYLPTFIVRAIEDGFDANPPFQRNHVWSDEQRTRYIEFILRGGDSGRNIYTNAKNWNKLTNLGPYVLVDGKQRLDAVLGFLSDEVRVFGGNVFSEYTGVLRFTSASFRWHVNDLDTYKEVLQWYVDLNDGGVVHTPQEISKVRTMADLDTEYLVPDREDRENAVGWHSRAPLMAARDAINEEKAKQEASNAAEVAKAAAREAIAKTRKGKRK